ncbi:MAG: hypothetical protein WCI73_04235 [Phycisphaerae bacterium]
MTPGLKDYISAAFHARPWGMFVPPNWIALGAFALGGLINPGFWILGAGLELGYLYLLGMNPRFQRIIQGQQLLAAQQSWLARQQHQLTQLTPPDQNRYRQLEKRCAGILEQQRSMDTSPLDLQAQGGGLSRLIWIYLRLLLTRQAIDRVLGDAQDPESEQNLQERISQLAVQIHDQRVSEDIRNSLSGQKDILEQRLAKQKEGREKLTFLEAEMTRIEEQVELIREQAAVSADPKTVSQRIDLVTADLSGRSQWLQEQQQMYGGVEDLLNEPPPLIGATTKPMEGQRA